jgi:hypothetical protein
MMKILFFNVSPTRTCRLILQEREIQHNQSYTLKGKKMRKYTIITLVMIMLAISVIPAFAAGGPPADRGSASGNGNGNAPGFGVRTPYALSGSITAKDDVNHILTVHIYSGNRQVKPYFGLDVTVQTTENTRFLLRNLDGSVTPITFEDLVEGENVSSHGILAEGVLTATRVTMVALLTCLP